MTQFVKLAVALALIAVAGTAALAAQPETPAAKADPTAAISDVRLGEMLEGLGVTLKKGTYKSGAAYYDTTVSTKDYDFNVRVGLSPNGRCIWLMAYLDDLPTNTPPERLRALLEAINSKTGKLQFRLVGDQLKADQPIDNFAVTPQRLRKELDDFANSLQETDAVWSTKKWNEKAGTAAKTESK
jgi:hypothetical protein